MRLGSSTALILLVIAACSDDVSTTHDGPGAGDGPTTADAGDAAVAPDARFPNQPGGNPLVPEVAAYPFPSDFYLGEDSTTVTGRRIEIPAEALPKGLTPGLFQKEDGFTRLPAILAHLPGGVDAASLPDPGKPELTVSADSPAFLVREKTWEKVPILIENDLTTPLAKNQALIIRPLVGLDFDTGYVVVLRDRLRTPAGKPHSASPAFAALRDDVETGDPAVEAQREDFKLVRAAIKALALDPRRVVLAWSFHTRSEQGVTRTLLAMHDIVDKAPLGAYTIVKDTTDSQGTPPRKNRQIEATFKAPNFVDPKTMEIKLDADGKPIQVGETDVSFGVTIPLSIDEPRPVILYGHGFFGHWIQGTRGSFNELCHEGKFSAVSTNVGFNSDNQALALTAFAEMGKFRQVVATNLQTFVNFTALARLVKEKLADDITVTTGAGATSKVFDPDQVHYMGISNGATFGLVVAATSPRLTRAALIVGGGGLSHFLQRAVQWNQYGALFKIAYGDALERQLVLSLMQNAVDPIDSINYVSRLVRNRFPGRKPLKAALHMAVNDCQVNNMVTEWVARTAGLPLITPSPKQVYGLQTITAAPPDGAPAGTGGALYVYDEKVAAPPVGNLPPKTDNGTHGSVRKLASYKTHIAEFIEEGKLVQVCSGACDPE